MDFKCHSVRSNSYFIQISIAGGQGQQRALKSWLAPEISKVMLDESAPADRNSGNQTIIHRSTEPLKTEAGESIPVKSPALDVPKLPLNTSAQDNNDLHAGIPSSNFWLTKSSWLGRT